MNKQNAKLYNVIFPVWMLLIFPQIWLIVFPANFIIDSLVLLLSMHLLKIADKKLWYKKHILKIFIFGLLADFIGSALMFLAVAVLDLSTTGDDLYLTIPAVLISAVIIFLFNYCFTFKKAENKIRIKTSLLFAVITAPYTFLSPTSVIY